VRVGNPPKRKDSAFNLNETNAQPNQKASSLGSGSYKTAAVGVSSSSSTTTSSFSSIASFVPRSQVIGRKKTLDIKK
jgi:hypothetical protein